MSFLSVLKSIGGVFGKVTAVVTPLEPVIGAIPVFGQEFNTVFNAVVAVESLFAGTPKTGAEKKLVVTKVVNATSPSPITEPALSASIDQIVAALNQLQSAQAAVSVNPPATGTVP